MRTQRTATSTVGGRRLFIGALATVAVLCSLAVVPASSASTPRLSGGQTTTITASGETPYTVPAGTALLKVTVVGAAGSDSSRGSEPPGTPGSGAELTTTFAPPAGVTTLYVEVGTPGGAVGSGSSVYAAAGGGASDIQTCSVSASGCAYTAVPSTDPRLVVAGGGGGGGETGHGGSGGSGGNAGGSSVTGPGAGGAGTDSGNAAPGSDAGLASSAATAPGGAGSTTCGGTGEVGGPGQGGAGENADDDWNGGGGGGGWVGGSGGGTGGCATSSFSGAGGGGGAGASYVESSAFDTTLSEAGSTAPEVVITAYLKSSTTTSVSCKPDSVRNGNSTKCTATVTNSASYPATPTGKVSFSSTGTGSFSASSCTLVPSSTAGRASCVVNYTPSAAGTQGITASYPGDSTHLKSSDETPLTVTKPPPKQLRLSVSPGKAKAGVRTCFTFTATAKDTPVSGVKVTFANHHADTSSSGKARVCVRLSKGSHTAGASKHGYLSASVSVHVAAAKHKRKHHKPPTFTG